MSEVLHIIFSKFTAQPFGTIQDISVQGCCLKIPLESNRTSQQQEDILTSEIHLHDQKQQNIGRAQIVWSTEKQQDMQCPVLFMGLSFEYENTTQKQQIEKMLYSAFSGI